MRSRIGLGAETPPERDEILREAMDSVKDVVWIHDLRSQRVVYVNAAYEKVWGRSRARLTADPADWLEAVHPDDRARVAASGCDAFDDEYRIVLADGAVRWIHARTTRIFDANGSLVRLSGLAEDITEKRELESQLRATQRMESLGQLAGGVAHDFNNLLTVIVACTDEVLEGIDERSPLRMPLAESRLAVQRAGSLTRDLLSFSRRQQNEPKVTDLNDVVREAERMLRRLLGKDVELRTDLTSSPCRVRVDLGQWTSVLVNLAVNARHAMPDGGTLTFRTREIDLDGNAKHGRGVLLEVIDTGEGFGPDVAERIFEPFFTTKEAGEGTGLGLAVVKGIVKQSGGFIEASSVPGVGTTFGVHLPLAKAPVASALATPTKGARGTETVLLVEDEAAVRRAARRGLEARGFKVLIAGTGEDAVRMLEERSGAIDLLVTDVVLPKMTGMCLVQVARQRWPELKFLLTSGYTTEDVRRPGDPGRDIALIEKPYTVTGLVRRMRNVLDAPH